MKRYELRIATFEVKAKDYNADNLGSYYIEDKYSDGREDSQPYPNAIWDDLSEALKKKEQETNTARYMSSCVPCYLVSEYYIAELEYDEDCEEWLETGCYY